MTIDHETLLRLVIRRHTDFVPYGSRQRTGADCSQDCKWFIRLSWPFNLNWGICVNNDSPRCGLLTFEHQGCPEFQEEEKKYKTDNQQVLQQLADHYAPSS